MLKDKLEIYRLAKTNRKLEYRLKKSIVALENCKKLASENKSKSACYHIKSLCDIYLRELR